MDAKDTVVAFVADIIEEKSYEKFGGMASYRLELPCIDLKTNEPIADLPRIVRIVTESADEEEEKEKKAEETEDVVEVEEEVIAEYDYGTWHKTLESFN